MTVNDVETALRAENVELPAGSIESRQRQLTVRVERGFRTPEDFGELVLGQGADGYLVRLGDVARVEKGAVEERIFFRGNGVPMVGIGIIKQSQANTLAVAQNARDEAARLNKTLPEGMEIKQSYDTSVFIQGAIDEVYKTLVIAIGMVVLVIYLFLGSVRAMIVAAVTVPVSLTATFIVLYALGFSINLFTLLALVLAIGLVVDDAIVVLENIHRRMDEGESPLVAAFRGARQVGFAVVATTLVLVSVFVPIAFLEGDVGRLFTEFALTIAAAVAFSSIVALTLSPMLASRLLRPGFGKNALARGVERTSTAAQRAYRRALAACLRRPVAIGAIYLLVLGGGAWLFSDHPRRVCPEGGPGRVLPHRRRSRGRVLRLHGRVHGRDRAPDDAARGRGRGDAAAGAGPRASSATWKSSTAASSSSCSPTGMRGDRAGRSWTTSARASPTSPACARFR